MVDARRDPGARPGAQPHAGERRGRHAIIMRRALMIALAAVAVALPAAGCGGGGGGGGGRVQLFTVAVDDGAAGGAANDFGETITLDAFGRILVVGESENTFGDSDMTIWRYNADGTPDLGFGFSGVVVDDGAAGGFGDDLGGAIVLDALGRILVAGASENTFGDLDLAIWRYDTAGSLDATFGAGGIVVHDDAAGGQDDDTGYGIDLDGSGRIIVAGESLNTFWDYDMVIWAYTPAGNLDVTFGSGGIVVDDNAAGGMDDDSGHDVAVDSFGDIVVAGESLNGFGDFDMVIWRYTGSGNLDPTFGFGGIVVHDDAAGGLSDDTGYSVALDPFDWIVVSGVSTAPAGDGDMVIWVYDPSGSLEPMFNGVGYVVRDTSGGLLDIALDVTVDALGRIVAAGAIQRGTDLDMAVWRYLPDGRHQSTVRQNNAAGGNGWDMAAGLVGDSLGGVYVTGASVNAFGDFDMVIWLRVE